VPIQPTCPPVVPMPAPPPRRRLAPARDYKRLHNPDRGQLSRIQTNRAVGRTFIPGHRGWWAIGSSSSAPLQQESVPANHEFLLAVANRLHYGAGMPDALVQAAIDHWGPRFTANGVDPNDFARVTARIERWDDWLDAWCAEAAVHEELGRRALAEGCQRSAGAHLARAAVYYHFAKFLFVHDLPRMTAAHERAVACLDAALPYLVPPGRRLQIPYRGRQLAGVLRIPGGGGPFPTVILVPGLDSTKEELRATEELFLARGLATVAVDGPGQGEAELFLPLEPAFEHPGGAVLDALGELPEVDPSRLGVWGVSLGGYFACRLAAADPRVRACVTLGGPYDFGATFDRLPALTRRAFQVRAGCPDEAIARQRAAELTLEGWAERIGCPLQIVFGAKDPLFPLDQARRLAAEARGPVTLLLLDEGNHGCTNLVAHHRFATADWMARQLGGELGLPGGPGG